LFGALFVVSFAFLAVMMLADPFFHLGEEFLAKGFVSQIPAATDGFEIIGVVVGLLSPLQAAGEFAASGGGVP
jgi:hypothetical protein